MARGAHITETQKEEIRQLASEGLTQRDIAAKIGRAYGTVNRVLANKSALPADLNRIDDLTQALNSLERRFPGVLNQIRDGSIKFTTEVTVRVQRA